MQKHKPSLSESISQSTSKAHQQDQVNASKISNSMADETPKMYKKSTAYFKQDTFNSEYIHPGKLQKEQKIISELKGKHI